MPKNTTTGFAGIRTRHEPRGDRQLDPSVRGCYCFPKDMAMGRHQASGNVRNGGRPVAQAKTSASHPLRIDAVTAPGGGLIGMTFCPGKKQVSAVSGTWDRDLGADLDLIREWGAVH